MNTQQNPPSEIDGIPGLVAILTPDGAVDAANPQILEYCGLSIGGLKAWGTNGTVHSEDVLEIAPTFVEAIGSGQPYDYECRIRRFDGAYRWFQVRGLPFREGGRIARWYVLLTDIEDKKVAEENLRARERDLRLIVDSIPAGAALLSPAGEVEVVNDQMASYFGKTFEELRRWGTSDACHPDDLPRVLEKFRRSILTGEPFDSEQRQRRFDGAYRWFQVRGRPIRDASGAVVRWNVLHIDIEDRKQAEEARGRSEAVLAQGETVSDTGSFLWNLETREIRWSDQLMRLFGFESGPITLERIADRVHPLDHPAMQEMVDRARAGLDSEYEHRLLMPDGAIKFMHFVAKSTRDRAGRLEYMGTVQDITGRKLAELAHDRVRSELAHAARVMSLGVLTASLAHEVNQPLAGIITNANTCVRMLSADPPNVNGALETARRTIRDGNRASDVVTRLRSMFGKKEFATETVDLNDAIREVIALSAHELQRNHISILTEYAGGRLEVIGDRVQIQQVVLNLLLNARDAVGNLENGRRSIAVRTNDDGAGSGQVTVCDSGVGIAPEAFGKLFDPFYTTKPDGMGIGLSVSRSIIDRHNGRLWAVANDGGLGAMFAFSIPAAGATAPAGQ